ncbi:MAG: gas vesicle protein K [Pseudomonadota bacterium]
MTGATPVLAGTEGTDPGRELARLLLAIMEVLRELMELQAIRHLEAGLLSEEEENRLSQALESARHQIETVAAGFGFDGADLALDLGDLIRIERS